jgi:cell wall-associated NlpC family hydrolase
MERNLSHYIGRNYEQVNCWDLVREFYLKEFGIELRQYYGKDLTSTEQQSLILSNRGSFTKVADPQFGDLMLLKLYGIECHIGIFIGEGKFLHSIKTTGSVLDSLDRYKHLISGYYRHWAGARS